MNTQTNSVPTVQDALSAIPRRSFLPERAKRYARVNVPVSIGFGQTNSQPYTVQLMLEWLEVEPGDRVLDVGSGSGWTTALLAYLTGRRGRVIAVERIPELVECGRANCLAMRLHNIKFYEAKRHVLGYPGEGPYDRILVSAAAQHLPQSLVSQLKRGGKMVIPVGDDILEIEKDKDGQVNIIDHSGFAFVPLL